ncbi:hypothetical protein D9757_000482 [Collybiopsis confluens]|uniref:Transmembrane protein n=1 Tax=Collybiopsis confluens TaxID=2823264 RepID=A0A8H5MGT2_9AGAR|nr:hypothetical protein D9757_000482 [Collybiopsis confluens]
MRFAAFTLLATIASAAFSYAAPTSPATNALEARHAGCECHDIQSVIYTATTAITPLVQKLLYIRSDNCTTEVLTPVLAEIKVVLTTTIADVKGLVGYSTTAILTTINGVVLTVADVAGLVCGLLNLIFGAVYVVLKVVASVDAAVIKPLLIEVLKIVAELLHCILCLIDGLLIALLRIVGGVIIQVIVLLEIKSVFYCFYTLY